MNIYTLLRVMQHMQKIEKEFQRLMETQKTQEFDYYGAILNITSSTSHVLKGLNAISDKQQDIVIAKRFLKRLQEISQSLKHEKRVEEMLKKLQETDQLLQEAKKNQTLFVNLDKKIRGKKIDELKSDVDTNLVYLQACAEILTPRMRRFGKGMFNKDLRDVLLRDLRARSKETLGIIENDLKNPKCDIYPVLKQLSNLRSINKQFTFAQSTDIAKTVNEISDGFIDFTVFERVETLCKNRLQSQKIQDISSNLQGLKTHCDTYTLSIKEDLTKDILSQSLSTMREKSNLILKNVEELLKSPEIIKPSSNIDFMENALQQLYQFNVAFITGGASLMEGVLEQSGFLDINRYRELKSRIETQKEQLANRDITLNVRGLEEDCNKYIKPSRKWELPIDKKLLTAKSNLILKNVAKLLKRPEIIKDFITLDCMSKALHKLLELHDKCIKSVGEHKGFLDTDSKNKLNKLGIQIGELKKQKVELIGKSIASNLLTIDTNCKAYDPAIEGAFKEYMVTMRTSSDLILDAVEKLLKIPKITKHSSNLDNMEKDLQELYNLNMKFVSKGKSLSEGVHEGGGFLNIDRYKGLKNEIKGRKEALLAELPTAKAKPKKEKP